jgi:hypothetical protein
VNLPIWATAVANPTEAMCECGLLPYIASVPLVSSRGRLAHTSAHPVCRACLMLEQATRGEVTFKVAGDYADALEVPEIAATYTREGVQRLFGVNYAAVMAWISCGWLRFPEYRATRKTVPFAEVVAFMRNPATWLAWEPERISEESLRRWATAYRAAWPWHWLRLAEAARALDYSRTGLRQLLQAGIIPATLYATRWYVRSDDVERFRLEVLPERRNGPAPMYGERMIHTGFAVPETYFDGIVAYGGGKIGAGVRRLWEEHLANLEQQRGAAD